MKTHQELGITYWEHQALQSVRVLLLAGRLRFDMRAGGPDRTCGCIGHWVQKMSPQSTDTYVNDYSGPLYCLYYPHHTWAWHATSDDGAHAIARFLAGEVDDPWAGAGCDPRVSGERVGV